MVECSCGRRAAVVWDRPLCREHLREKLFAHVKANLDRLLGNERIAVAASGGKDSTALLEIAHEWASGRGVELVALLVDEGIEGYRDRTRKFLEEFCARRGIPLEVVSFRDELGEALDGILSRERRERACTICGTFRRYLLNRRARELGAGKLLMAHNLDDEAQTFFMNLFSGNFLQLTTKGELGGIVDDEKFVRRVKPLLDVPEKVLAVYAALFHPDLPADECPYLRESSRFRVRELVNELELRKPGSKRSALRAYLSILPSLKSSALKAKGRLKKCRECGEPTSRGLCKACELRHQLKTRS